MRLVGANAVSAGLERSPIRGAVVESLVESRSAFRLFGGSPLGLRTGLQARVYSGMDPFIGGQTYLRGETRRHRRDAEADAWP
jgi:hypothetical protein